MGYPKQPIDAGEATLQEAFLVFCSDGRASCECVKVVGETGLALAPMDYRQLAGHHWVASSP